MESHSFCGISLLFFNFFLYLIFLSSTWIISRFLTSRLLILSFIWSALFLLLLNAFFFSFIEFLSPRTFVFRILISLVNYPFSNFVSSLNCLSEFSCSSLNFFIVTVILNSLSYHNLPWVWVQFLEDYFCVCNHITMIFHGVWHVPPLAP